VIKTMLLPNPLIIVQHYCLFVWLLIYLIEYRINFLLHCYSFVKYVKCILWLVSFKSVLSYIHTYHTLFSYLFQIGDLVLI
jgi:hypothetical protein